MYRESLTDIFYNICYFLGWNKCSCTDILYIENQKHGSIIYTKNGAYNTNTKPIEWYNIINQPNCFVFSHKSYLVNLQNVIYFSRQSVIFETGNEDNIEIRCIAQNKYLNFKKAFFNFVGGI